MFRCWMQNKVLRFLESEVMKMRIARTSVSLATGQIIQIHSRW